MNTGQQYGKAILRSSKNKHYYREAIPGNITEKQGGEAILGYKTRKQHWEAILGSNIGKQYWKASLGSNPEEK